MGMKLATEIKPRKDGKVIVSDLSGTVMYEFTPHPQDDGVMVGDVRDDKTVAHLLSTGNFFPASEKDDARAEKLLAAVEAELAAAAGEPVDDEAGDDPIDPNAAPVEGESVGE